MTSPGNPDDTLPRDPLQLLDYVSDPPPGWSEQWGGPIGVARAAVAAQDQLNGQAQVLAGMRTAAIRELLQTRSLSDVARELGVTKQAVSRIAHAGTLHLPTW